MKQNIVNKTNYETTFKNKYKLNTHANVSEHQIREES